MSDQNSVNLGGNGVYSAILGSEVGREGSGGGMASGGVSGLDAKIERQKLRIAKIDEQIGRMMSRRADMEDALAAMYARRNAPSPLATALKTILSPEFGA